MVMTNPGICCRARYNGALPRTLSTMDPLRYLKAYPTHLQEQVRR